MTEPITKATVEAWEAALVAFHGALAKYFPRLEPRERSLAYLRGLLSSVDRKNSWQVAEWIGERTPDGVQRLLSTAHWDVAGVRDAVRDLVIAELGTEEAVGVFDETGFLKKGTKSAGVHRQYSGTAGKIENCQIGVFLAWATPRGRALIDRELYLPEAWTSDRARCAEAGIPDTVAFATKPALARQMAERLVASGHRPSWMTGDEVYGSDPTLRAWLEGENQAYVLGVRRNHLVQLPTQRGLREREVRELPEWLGGTGWQRLSAGDGAKGPRVSDWARLPIGRGAPDGWERWVLLRRSVTTPDEIAFFVCFAPVGTSLATLVRVAGMRWPVEECFESAKDDVGLDEYEVRRYDGWYRHITLAMAAQAFLAGVRARARTEPEKGGPGSRRADPLKHARNPAPAGPPALECSA